MPDLVRVWTREEVLALPDDGNRYELVDGELLVSPSPRPLHQLAVAAFYREIEAYLRRHRLGVALFSPADLDLREGQLLQPDPRVVEVWTPTPSAPVIAVESLTWQPDGAPPPLVVDLPGVFRQIWGE